MRNSVSLSVKPNREYLRKSLGALFLMTACAFTSALPARGAAKPNDYDGDGITDKTVWQPSDGTWFFQFSSTGQLYNVQFGPAEAYPRRATMMGTELRTRPCGSRQMTRGFFSSAARANCITCNLVQSEAYPRPAIMMVTESRTKPCGSRQTARGFFSSAAPASCITCSLVQPTVWFPEQLRSTSPVR